MVETIENIRTRVSKIFPNITVIGPYKNMISPCLIEDAYGLQYNVRISNLLQGSPPSILTAVDKTKCFIKTANILHNYKYNYVEAKYVDYKTPIIIICPIHGKFYQTPIRHLNSYGCKKCGKENAISAHRFTKEVFIEICSKIHNNKYDYSLVEYYHHKDKITIICPQHGKFLQTANDHINGHGCIKCSGHQIRDIDKVRETAGKKHNYIYTYPDQKINKETNTIKITCKLHGEFSQNLESHLKGAICPLCRKELKRSLFKNRHSKLFINNAIKIHGDAYDYSKLNYINAKTKVEIKCNKCNSYFTQLPNNHINGTGCPSCNQIGGYKKTTWINHCISKKLNPLTYIIRCYNSSEEFIKIGITSSSIHKRFYNCLPYSYEILKEIKGSPDFIWDKEKELHRLCKNFRYNPKIKFAGETECFSLDCLLLLNL